MIRKISKKMFERDIKKILKKLGSIEPDPSYSARSRSFILSSKDRPAFLNFSFFGNYLETVRLVGVVGISAALLFMIFGGASYINRNFSPLPAGLNQVSLVTEAEEISDSIQITLDEVKYMNNSNDKSIETMARVAGTEILEEAAKQPAATPEKVTSMEVVDKQIYNLLEEASQ